MINVQFSQFNIVLLVGFSNAAFMVLRYIPSITNIFISVVKVFWIFKIYFSFLISVSMMKYRYISVLYFVNEFSMLIGVHILNHPCIQRLDHSKLFFQCAAKFCSILLTLNLG